MTNPKLEVITPQNSQLTFIDRQPQMAFGVQSIRMRSNVCALILATASLAPSALLAQPLDPAAGGATIIATAPGKGVAELELKKRGPTRVVDLRVDDAEQFKLVAVDQVEATYTEAVAISVEPAAERERH